MIGWAVNYANYLAYLVLIVLIVFIDVNLVFLSKKHHPNRIHASHGCKDSELRKYPHATTVAAIPIVGDLQSANYN